MPSCSGGSGAYIVRFKISVKDAIGVAKAHALQDLPHEGTDHGCRQTHTLVDVIAGLVLIHEALEIMCDVLKH